MNFLVSFTEPWEDFHHHREGSQDGGGLPGEATTLVQQFCADPPANQVRQTIVFVIIIKYRYVGNGEA